MEHNLFMCVYNVCVHMCHNIYIYECGYACVYHVWRSESWVSVRAFYLETESLIVHCCSRLAAHKLLGTVLSLPLITLVGLLRLQMLTLHIWLLHGFWGVQIQIHLLLHSKCFLPTEPTPQPIQTRSLINHCTADASKQCRTPVG